LGLRTKFNSVGPHFDYIGPSNICKTVIYLLIRRFQFTTIQFLNMLKKENFSNRRVSMPFSIRISSLLIVSYVIYCYTYDSTNVFGSSVVHSKVLSSVSSNSFKINSSITSSNSKINDIVVPVVLTLHFKSMNDSQAILHNCMASKSVNVRMIVHTEFMTANYCGVCECVEFTPTNCPPPTTKGKNHCEKIYWTRDVLEMYREFIFLDADLLLMHPKKFFYGIASRALSTDFLATYAHVPAVNHPHIYLTPFNSGMMFIRHIPTANYTDLVPRMYRLKRNSHQAILSSFIFEFYGNRWDTLSWKWHCRFLMRSGHDIDPAHCLTIHDRDEYEYLLNQLNVSLFS